MIYLISKNKTLFKSDDYEEIEFCNAISNLNQLKLIQLDSETLGLDCHTKKLLTLQLGNKDNQYVFDWTTITEEEKQQIKNLLENPNKIYLGWNIGFDLTFLYVQKIYPKNILDGMIIDQLIFLGYPRVLKVNEYQRQFGYEPIIDEEKNVIKYYELRYSLKAAAHRWLNLDIDKTVRGQIITQGLTPAVIKYAAGDVMWLEDIYNKQCEELTKQDLHKAVKFECESVKSVAYTKYCGIHLDKTKWKAKMDKDQERLNAAIEKLNQYVVNLHQQNPDLYKSFVQWETAGLFDFIKEGYKCTINWKSSKQVIPLFHILGINTKTYDKKTKKETDSIEKEILIPQKDKFPILPLFLDYQGASKLVSTYGQNWLDAINPKTGRIHAELHTIGTNTSRMSSGGGPSGLNLQNLPHDKETRACFTSEKGNIWISADYQSQESRLIASVSGDKAMIDLFETGCGDVHSLVAYMAYPNIVPRNTRIEDISKLYHEARQDAKGVEFAVTLLFI